MLRNMRFILPQQSAKCRNAKKVLRPLLAIATTSVLLAIFCVGVSTSQNPAPPDRSDILQFLDQTINWYRQIDVERQIATEPEDIIAVSDDRALADQIASHAFECARAEADFSAQAAAGSNQAQNPEGGRYQSLLQLAHKLDQQVKDTQTELQSDREKLEHLTGKKRQDTEATIAELQSEIDLANARRDIIVKMADFVGGSSANGLGTTSLRGQIDALARTLPPEAGGYANGATSTAAPSHPVPAVP